MKKKTIGMLCMAGLLFAMALPVHAETYKSDGWKVTFSGESKMESNFTSKDTAKLVSAMQPGDNVVITMELKNEHGDSTDWYMTNKVLDSLENTTDNENATGSAYTYRLSYTDNKGEVTMLFDSDTVGGDDSGSNGRAGRAEDEVGLHAATSALKEYFLLDTLEKGQTGVITLEVGLDGETHGNDYQDTLADLQMNFAVERRATEPGVTRNVRNLVTRGDVQTSDQSHLLLFTVLTLGSGLVLLGLCIFYWRARRREEEEVG